MDPYPTDEEIEKIKRLMLLSLLQRILERDQKLMKKYLKLSIPYEDFMQKVLDAVSEDFHKTRRALRNAGIKIFDEKRSEKDIRIKYLCRGRTYSSSFLWPYVKGQVIELLKSYLERDYSEQEN